MKKIKMFFVNFGTEIIINFLTTIFITVIVGLLQVFFEYGSIKIYITCVLLGVLWRFINKVLKKIYGVGKEEISGK